MAKKKERTPQETSLDQASVQMLELACQMEAETAFSRADELVACNIGAQGLCCKNCSMGPCRLVKAERGVCGATRDVVAARNFARSVAAGASAHSDHGRGLAHTLLEAATGHAPDYGVRDPNKLMEVAGYLDVATTDEDGDRRPIDDIAKEVAEAALNEFGKHEGTLKYLKRAPAKRQEIWDELGIATRASLAVALAALSLVVVPDLILGIPGALPRGTRVGLAVGWFAAAFVALARAAWRLQGRHP